MNEEGFKSYISKILQLYYRFNPIYWCIVDQISSVSRLLI